MKKVSVPASNDFCAQTPFLFGTYREDGTPNFGLFTWVSYCWDGEFRVMACIGEDKLTRDRIRKTGIFSANLVTKALLPFADKMGHTSGYKEEKEKITVSTTRGEKLDVPLLDDSPWSYELRVKRTFPFDGGGELYVSQICNVMAAEELTDKTQSVEARTKAINPIKSVNTTYFDFEGKTLGEWGQPQISL